VTSSSHTVLVCEDDPSLRLLLRIAIEREGHQVVEAGEGRAAIDLARSVSPDLVLVDMGLPDCDGIQVVHALRASPGLESLPILMVTGSIRPDDRLAVEHAGVDGFFSKPFDPTELADEVARLLERRQPGNQGLPIRRLY
jgi:DNA-binding response OmpR family regulator